METPAESRAQAERTLRQRSLEKLTAKVPDPNLRAMGRQLASGQMRADEFVRQMERSPALMRGFDRCIKHYATLTPEELAAAKADHDRQVDAVAAELSAVDRGAQRPRQAPRVRRETQEESWENRSWLE